MLSLQIRNNMADELEGFCLPQLEDLCNKAGLTKQQKLIIIERCNKGNSVENISYDFGMCETCVKKFYRIGLERIYNYKNYLTNGGQL